MKIVILFLLLAACATRETTPTGLHLMSESEYEKVVDRFSDRIESYKGLYNSSQASGTVINSKVAFAQLDQNARLYQWDQEKFSAERQTTQKNLEQGTEIFLSFFTPEKKHDDLAKHNSMWKIFLDVNGKRYEGKATKVKSQTVEIQGLFPYHTGFSTPYKLVFPVTVKSIESHPLKLTLTGPAGTAVLKFAPASTL